jgi:hypothetical protein
MGPHVCFGVKNTLQNLERGALTVVSSENGANVKQESFSEAFCMGGAFEQNNCSLSHALRTIKQFPSLAWAPSSVLKSLR